MLTEDGTFMLADFGIASFRNQVASGDEGMVMGTPGYLAPECYSEKTQDPRTDLFALGVTLVECLTCRKVFHGKSVEQVIVRTSSWEVEMPSELAGRLPEGMTAFLEKLVAKRQGDRYQSASEALAALRAILDPEGAAEEARVREAEENKEQESREDVPTQAMGDPDLGATREFDS